MQEKTLDCRVSFSKKGIVIDSGMPEQEPVLDEGVGTHRATVELCQNASAKIRFYNPTAYIPPLMEDVLKTGNLMVKRTSRHFIVTMKFPIIEDSDATAQAHKDMWKKSQKAITSAREEIKQTF